MTTLGLAHAFESRAANAIAFEHVSLAFDETVVLRDISFVVPAGSTTVLLGASGTGKSVILKLILGLLRPDDGHILVNAARVDGMPERDLIAARSDVGMLFQESALFDSLTVAENVGYRLTEELGMPANRVRARVEEVLGFIDLGEYIDAMPSDLSGGQRRRVAIARAMAAQPKILLFDDPTSGLDPILARTVDDEIIKVRDLEQVTTVVVTHQLPDAFYIAMHEARRRGDGVDIVAAGVRKIAQAQFLLLKDGRIHFAGSVNSLRASPDPHVHSFVTGWEPSLV